MKSLASARAPANNPTFILPRSLLLLAGLSAFAAAAYAIGWDADHARSSFRVSTLILLLVSGALMLVFAFRMGRKPARNSEAVEIGWSSWARILLIGLGWSYFVALAAGPQPGVAYVFLAAMASWVCAFSWLWLAAPRARNIAAELGKRWWIRSAVAGMFWTLMALTFAEGGLRLVTFCRGRALFRTQPAMAAADSPSAPGFAATQVADGATIPTSITPTIRIAVLGGPTEIGVSELSSQLGTLLPGVEVRNFTSAAGPLLGYRDGLSAAIDAYQPQLLLVFLTVDVDLACGEPTASPFDWREMQLVQAVQALVGNNAAGRANTVIGSEKTPNTYRRFLESCSLSVCRKPLEESVLMRWNKTLARIDELAARCEKSATTLGIVLAPAEFQLDPATLEALCRCAGCTTEQVDLDLPQRRTEAYAAGHHLPCIDLLPYLRASKSLPYCRHSRQWNETGNTIVASAVAQFVMNRYGNQMAASSTSR